MSLETQLYGGDPCCGGPARGLNARRIIAAQILKGPDLMTSRKVGAKFVEAPDLTISRKVGG